MANTTIRLDGDKTVVARFSEIGDTHTLTVRVKGAGATVPEVGTHDYDEKSIVDITAMPESGWQFEGWDGDVTDDDEAALRQLAASIPNFL